MASLDFETEKKSFRDYYDNNFKFLEDAENLFRSLIVSLVSDREDMETPSVISRLKDREEYIGKFARKYQGQLEDAGNTYEIKDYITDLMGIRVICLYQADTLIVKQILSENFSVIGVSDKTAAMEKKEDAFGYKGLHMDLTLNKARGKLPEYARYKDLRFEVQIRTIVQDAWSVLDHKIKYKKAVPTNLKRRINTLAALFELADREFLSLREETQRIRKETEASKSTKKEQEDIRLDVFQFLKVVEEGWPNYDFFNYKADGFVQEALDLAPDFTVSEFVNALADNMDIVNKYAKWLEGKAYSFMNPYTQLRHALYLYDRDRFGWMLFDLQRNNFEKWLEEGSEVEDESKESESQ